MLQTELQELKITLTPIANKQIYFIRVNGQVVGNVSGHDGAVVNLYKHFDNNVQQYLFNRVQSLLTNKLKTIAVAPDVSELAQKERAIDDETSFDP